MRLVRSKPQARGTMCGWRSHGNSSRGLVQVTPAVHAVGLRRQSARASVGAGSDRNGHAVTVLGRELKTALESSTGGRVLLAGEVREVRQIASEVSVP